MVVKHLNPGGLGEGGGASHLVEPIEQLKRGCFALLARHNETACGRHVYSQKRVGEEEEVGGKVRDREEVGEKRRWER